jgi:sterol desaturase/sphingolipid hydroxylase (fatty acid hydroxylase superfamily)
MNLMSFEHGRHAYVADFVFYGSVVAVLSAALLLGVPRGQALQTGTVVVLGVVAWTLLEYALHRWVLHKLPPFSRWHAQHHARPRALICAPTLLSAALIAGLIFLPALLLAGLWPAVALTLGVLVGYLAYAVAHHTIHHGQGGGAWLRQRRRRHAQHHHLAAPRCFGVSTGLWDHAFGSMPRRRA